jgi:glucan phosphoethanolaminetransferase (alkaline phosphatase superfamily)
MPTSRPQIAFLAAALVLLVLPILVMLGLSAFGVAMHFGMMSQMEGMMNGEASAAFLVLFIAWVLIVLAVVFALVSRLVRATRS